MVLSLSPLLLVIVKESIRNEQVQQDDLAKKTTESLDDKSQEIHLKQHFLVLRNFHPVDQYLTDESTPYKKVCCKVESEKDPIVRNDFLKKESHLFFYTNSS